MLALVDNWANQDIAAFEHQPDRSYWENGSRLCYPVSPELMPLINVWTIEQR